MPRSGGIVATLRRGTILSYLIDNPNQTAGVVRRECSMGEDPKKATNMIVLLRNEGLIQKHKSSRAGKFKITPKGRSYFRRANFYGMQPKAHTRILLSEVRAFVTFVPTL